MFFLIVFAMTLGALLITWLRTPVYRARTLLEIQNWNEDFLNMRAVTPTASSSPFQSPEYNIRTQTTVLQSRPVVERAIEKADIKKRLLAIKSKGRTFPWFGVWSHREHEAASLHHKALSAAQAGLKVRTEPNTRVVEVTFESADPRLAADIANSIATAFSELSRERRWLTSQNTSEWLAKQVDDVKANLQRAEDALQRYAIEANLTILSEKDDVSEERLRQLQAELSKAQAERVVKQSTYELASTVSSESLPEVLDDATLKEYHVQLTALRRRLAEMSSSFTPEHPKMVNARAQIATIEAALERKRSNIASRIRNEYSAAARREKLLSADYAAQAAFVSKQATKIAHYSNLKRDVDAGRQLYDSMMLRVREAGLASAMQASDVRTIESAATPTIPYSPNIVLNTAFGLLTGICMGAAFIIYRARSYRGILEPGQLAVELDMRELGVIPTSGSEFSRIQRLLGKSRLGLLPGEGEGRPELTTWQQWPSPIGESFRLTLTSILLAEKNGEFPRVIALTSANPGEGKSTVVSNLAVAFARVDRRVLLIDGDLRKPRLHEILEVDNSVGLSEALASNSFPAIRETKIPNLFLLPSGNSGDEKLFFTSQLSQLLRRLNPDFDMILIDTPPVLQTSDARLLSHCAQAVILVVAQHTDRDAVLIAQRRLAEDGAYLLGSILNNWDPKDSIRPQRESDYHKYYYGSRNRKGEVS